MSGARKAQPPCGFELERARNRVLMAEGEWDFENEAGGNHDCCRELRAASAHLRLLRQRFKAAFEEA